MSSEEKILTFTLQDEDTDNFPVPNSSGQNTCKLTKVVGPTKTYECSLELFDNEDQVKKTIDFFGTNEISSIEDKIQFCQGVSSDRCNNWRKINSILLPSYCQRISVFSNLTGGGCPTYVRNPFNPLYPTSKGCSNMVKIEGICQEWISANYNSKKGGVSSYPDGSIQDYCDKVLSPDCACQNAQDSVVFDLVTRDVGGLPSTICWWKPCTLDEGNFLVRKNDVPADCPESVCVSVANVFLQNDEIGKDVIINQVNACGNDNGGTVWYKQWWVWIIVLAIITLIFMVIIYYTNKL